jgi:hypothetical protein
MSFLDWTMVLAGVAIGSFFAGWFAMWSKLRNERERHGITRSLCASAYADIEKRLAFSKAANKDLAEGIHNRDEQIGKHSAEVGKLYTLIQGLRNENANVRELVRLTGDQLKAAKLRPLPDSRADGGKGVAAMVKDFEHKPKKRARK